MSLPLPTAMQLLHLDALDDPWAMPPARPGRLLAFGVRWQDGEIASEILVADMVASHLPRGQRVDYGGHTWSLAFDDARLREILTYNESLPAQIRPSTGTALRYAVEFGALLTPGDSPRDHTGPRSPQAFQQTWLTRTNRAMPITTSQGVSS